MHMRRHTKISLQSTTTERLGKMATEVKVHCKTDYRIRREGKVERKI